MARTKLIISAYLATFTDHSACWLWPLNCNSKGYGMLNRTGVSHLAHRAAWEVVHGPIPDGLCVLHSCDNPPCINPSHLFLGTQLDNMRDRTNKGRQGRGNAKLTDEHVRAIRAATGTQKSIAQQFGIDDSSVSDIRAYRSWKHVR